MSISYTCTMEEKRELESLAYWISTMERIKSEDGENCGEILSCRATIEKCIFPALDRLGVPFWVQNSVISWATDWKNTISEYLSVAMRRKNITL